MIQPNNITIIGQAEQVYLPEIGNVMLHARIDTGARTSSIWAQAYKDKNGELLVTFFNENSNHYTGEVYRIKNYSETVVASSNGQTEARYKIKLLVVLAGRKIRANFTLADRSTQVYPMLIGRNVLRGKYLVDVKQGSRLVKEEKARSKKLKTLMEE
jgi:hypothetical protein